MRKKKIHQRPDQAALDAAVARLYRMREGEGLIKVYENEVETRNHIMDMWFCDKAIVAEQYLFDHDPDSSLLQEDWEKKYSKTGRVNKR